MAGEINAKSEAQGKSHTWSTQQWVLEYACTQQLLTHNLGRRWLTVLDEKDVAHDLKTAHSVKVRNGFFTANDVICYDQGPDLPDDTLNCL